MTLKTIQTLKQRTSFFISKTLKNHSKNFNIHAIPAKKPYKYKKTANT